MPGKLNSLSAVFAFTVVVLCLMTVNSATAQTQQCSDLTTATGQPGWMLVSAPGLSAPKAPINVTPYPGWKNPALPGSNWVSINPQAGNLPGNYTYEFPFCLCKEGKHLLNLSFYADNGAKVFLNNTQIFATTGISNFTGAPKVVTYSWASGPGTNILRIVVNNQSLVTGLDAVLKITGADKLCCRATPASNSFPGRVVDQRNTPVEGVEVNIQGRDAVRTNSNGEFEIHNLQPTERLAVSFSARGFMNTTRIYRVGESSGNGTTVVIWPRASPVPLDAARGGRVSFLKGGGVTIPPNALVDINNRPVSGKVLVSLTQLDVSDRDQLRTMAGDFKARMSDKSIKMLESFGVFEIAVVDDRGERVNLAPGKTVKFDLPVPHTLKDRVPKRSRLFSFDTSSGFWIEEGEAALTEQLVYSGTINRFDWEWNLDNPLDTTCITVKFVDIFGANAGPIANALVEAKGVTYNTISSGYTNSAGLVCLLVKINSAIEIRATDPVLNTVIGPITVMSPNIVSGASDCGDPTLCPLITTVEQDARLLSPDTNQVMTRLALHVTRE